ncbi:MAG: DUF177 domain-containing protein [Candidatus Acetothermia bacterium]|jgi:uncharacterized protein|nr:DUF177 domain-containing protein [Candidatus Acetothermia bacterium]MDH7504724.1 DUF177 domain-containing protein [Candidatus Acetothermia bacterium]
MDLSIKELKRHAGKTFPFAGEAELLPREGQEAALVLRARVGFRGEAVYRAEKVHLALKLRAEVERACSRCLDRFTETIEKEERITLREEREVGLADEDFAYPDEAEQISLIPYLRSLVFGSLGPKPLCRPDCAGLCPSCGANLNREEHRPLCPELTFREEKVDPRLAQLSKWL